MVFVWNWELWNSGKKPKDWQASRLHSEIRIADLPDFGGGHTSLKEDRLATLKGFVDRFLPSVGDYGHSVEGSVGARPTTPDGLPITRAMKINNVFLNTGHGMRG